MAASLSECQTLAVEKHPRKNNRIIQYGTAGFREKGNELDSVMFRIGILAVLRSKYKKAAIGAMITASHNPEEDNGVKLVDPMGEMLEVSWEELATHLANVRDDDIVPAIEHIIASCEIDMETPATIIVGRDTRQSSVALCQALVDGVNALQARVLDKGLLTTPQLHYIVCCYNTDGEFGEPSEEGYYNKTAAAFTQLYCKSTSNGSSRLCVDGANGVGALKMKELAPRLNGINFKICNDGAGQLNYMCGADYVKIQQKAPQGIPLEHGLRYASLDGDADRLMYFYLDSNGVCHIMDGDKLATLFASYLQELVSKAELDISLGIVQTAYANGSSTNYISTTLNVPVACVPTGVKHLHHKAQEFDIGVYFEANGHGTVVFSYEVLKKIKSTSEDQSVSERVRDAAETLLALSQLINQTVGDAISDLLVVEVILRSRGWSVEDWDTMYNDLPNRQIKVKVADRNAITTTDAERRCVTPCGLQDAIDDLVSQVRCGRSFVRPSGTEDVVRVYAEGETQEAADQLAKLIGVKVSELAGGC